MMRKLILTVITLTTLALSATPAQFTPPTNLATIPTANYHDCLNRCARFYRVCMRSCNNDWLCNDDCKRGQSACEIDCIEEA